MIKKQIFSLIRLLRDGRIVHNKLIFRNTTFLYSSLRFSNNRIKMRQLAVFDFDNTLLDDNTDTAVIALIDKDSIPPAVKQINQTQGWTAFMQEIFFLLHEKGVSADQIKDVVANMAPAKGMTELVHELKKNPSNDLIIISDSNTCFIKLWLEKQGIEQFFTRIFTNPSEIVDDTFRISPYHHQERCKLSSPNLCKGQVLDEFLEEQRKNDVIYDRIVYVGDGANDFCPILHLKGGDIVYARNSHKLIELLEKAKKGQSLDNSGKPHVIHAEVLCWETGEDILKHLQGSYY